MDAKEYCTLGLITLCNGFCISYPHADAEHGSLKLVIEALGMACLGFDFYPVGRLVGAKVDCMLGLITL